MATMLDFPPRPIPPRLRRLAENLYIMPLSDTPEAHAAADKLVAELREHNYIVPDYMKGDDVCYEKYFDNCELANKHPLSFDEWVAAGKP
jgi:hypothetical protein